MMSLESIVDKVKSYPTEYVCVTGGEPLAQPAVFELMTQLCDLGLQVSTETSGAMDIGPVDARVSRVMDLKAPGSAESHRNLYSNIEHLDDGDQVKFVLADRQDYDWARMKIDEYRLSEKVAEVLMSPVHGELNPRDLAEWILEDGLSVRMQLQMHKYLWGEEPGH